MLGADSFPYRNITVDDDLFVEAMKALRSFYFIGLQEEFEISVQALLREMNFPHNFTISIPKEREQQSNRKIALEKKEIRENDSLLARVRIANIHDIRLYRQGKRERKMNFDSI